MNVRYLRPFKLTLAVFATIPRMSCRYVARSYLILNIVLLALAARADTTVFDTFGPGDTYAAFPNYTVNGAPAFRSEIAAQFTAGANGDLSVLDLGMTYAGAVPLTVNAYLYGDSANSPDNASQIFLGSGTPTAFGGSTNSVVSIAVSGTIPVTLGSSYWLVLKPSDASGNIAQWNYSSPVVTGAVDGSGNDSTWAPVGATLPAFRLTAIPDAAVPEPATWFVGAIALFSCAFSLRRKIRVQPRGH